MSRTVIVINGRPRAGKDTTVLFMQEYLDRARIMSHAYSSIQPIKDMLGQWVDLSSKTPADRRLMALVGDALQEHSSFRTNRCLGEIRSFFQIVTRGVFFLHLREPELIAEVRRGCEADGIRFITIYLESSRAENVKNNNADAGVDQGSYDYRIENNGTLDDLRATSEKLLADCGLIV